MSMQEARVALYREQNPCCVCMGEAKVREPGEKGRVDGQHAVGSVVGSPSYEE